MKNTVWYMEGRNFSTPIRHVIVFNGNEAGARQKAKRLFGFTHFTLVKRLGQKKET